MSTLLDEAFNKFFHLIDYIVRIDWSLNFFLVHFDSSSYYVPHTRHDLTSFL